MFSFVHDILLRQGHVAMLSEVNIYIYMEKLLFILIYIHINTHTQFGSGGRL